MKLNVWGFSGEGREKKGEGDSFSWRQNFVDSFIKTGILCFRFLKCLGSASLSKKFANFMMKSETESFEFFQELMNEREMKRRERGTMHGFHVGWILGFPYLWGLRLLLACVRIESGLFGCWKRSSISFVGLVCWMKPILLLLILPKPSKQSSLLVILMWLIVFWLLIRHHCLVQLQEFGGWSLA